MRPTDENPTGLVAFDHSEVAHLPEYQLAYRALDSLVHAIRRGGPDVGQERWLAMVGEMAAALSFADSPSHRDGCPVEHEHKTTFPFRTELDRDAGSTSAEYACPWCRMKWSCGYSLGLPALFQETA